MRAFLAVFGREIVERRLLVAASLLLGLVPLAAPWIPGLAQRGDPELQSATALAIALSFSFGLALILGAAIIVGDLAAGRLGFYFARPIPGWAVWAGKLAAACGLALGVGALILLPSSLAERRLQLSGWWNEPLVGNAASALLWVGAVLLLAALGHAAGVALRSRTPWLILDFAGLGLTGWLAWTAGRRLVLAGAFGAANLSSAGLLGLALLALLAAGAVQVLGGRTDLRRGHRLLSSTLWGTLLAGTLAAQGYAAWVLAAGLGDLGHVAVTAAAPRGTWIAVYGAARNRAGYDPEFLLDVASRRAVRIAAVAPSFWPSPWFSADGRWAVWLEPQWSDARGGPFELLRLDLRALRSRPERTRIIYERLPSELTLSADGGRVAVASGRRLTIEEVPSGRLLASAELPRDLGRYEDSLRFMDSGHVRLYGSDLFENGDPALRSAFEAGEMRGAGVVRTARLDDVQDVEISPDGARILARRRSDGRFAVFDAGTGAVLAELPPAGELSRASFLADGRIALVSGGLGKELRIFSPGYAPEQVFRFRMAKSLRLAGEPAPDRLVVTTAPRGPEATRWDIGRTDLLDLSTGSVRRLGHGLLPAAGSHSGPESPASRLFLNHQGQLVQIDLENGRQVPMAGRRST